MIRLNAGFSRKVGEAHYGSRGASVNVELELESSLVGDPDALTQRIRELFALARQAVERELGTARDPTPDPNRPKDPSNGQHRGYGAAAPSPNGNGGSAVRQATVSQVRAIRSLGDRQGLLPDRLAQERFGVATVEELTLPEASTLIDELKATPAGGRNGGGR